MDLIYNFELQDSFYFEERENEEKEGYGTFIFPSGDIYTGLWKNDMMNGYGKYIQLNVGIFEGTFSKNKKHGNGCFSYFDKSFYNGSFVNDYKNGFGVYFKNNRLHYSGNWKKDMFHGFGKLYNNNGIIQYSGNFKRNKKHGKGKFYNRNGILILDGEWKHDKFIYEPSDKYQSFYRNGFLKYKGEVNFQKKYHGYGFLYNNDGTISYKGEFINGKKCGQGCFYHNNEVLYNGEWKNNKFNGNGILYTSNISLNVVVLYEGKFKNGKCHGHGIQFFRNGNVFFEGIFQNSEFKKGKKYDITGKLLYHGEFKNSLYHGCGTLFEENKVTEGTFIQGEFFDVKRYLIRNFIETRRDVYLKKFSKNDIREYSLSNFSKNISKCQTKEKMILELIQNYQISCKTNAENNNDMDKYDLFGNEIKNPCLGSDNEIYDLSSMEYLFEIDSSGKYKNISYTNSSPNFPVMKNGLVLSFYKSLS